MISAFLRAGAHFSSLGPHFDPSAEVAGKQFVGVAHTAYTTALKELIFSRQQPIPAQPAAAPGVLSVESALLQQLLTAIQSLQGQVGVPVNALQPPDSHQQPLAAPAQGQPLGSGILLPSLRLVCNELGGYVLAQNRGYLLHWVSNVIPGVIDVLRFAVPCINACHPPRLQAIQVGAKGAQRTALRGTPNSERLVAQQQQLSLWSVSTADYHDGSVEGLGIRAGVGLCEDRLLCRQKLRDFLRACLRDFCTRPHYE